MLLSQSLIFWALSLIISPATQAHEQSGLSERACIEAVEPDNVYPQTSDQLQWLDTLPQSWRDQDEWVVALNKTDNSVLPDQSKYFLPEKANGDVDEDADLGPPEPELAYNYVVNCNNNPTVCNNICYYVYCKDYYSGEYADGFEMTKNTTGGRNVADKCRLKVRGTKGNKCSKLSGFFAGSYDCDEYPLAGSINGGGSHPATRCVPRKQNRSAGKGYSSIPRGATSTTVLDFGNSDKRPNHCKPYARKKKTCYKRDQVCKLDTSDGTYKQE